MEIKTTEQFNDRVMNARVSAGKELPPEIRKKRSQMLGVYDPLTVLQKDRVRLIYGLVLTEGGRMSKDMAERSGLGRSTTYALMEKMVEMGLLCKVKTGPQEKAPVIYKAYADAEVPAEWDMKEVMQAAREFKPTVPQEINEGVARIAEQAVMRKKEKAQVRSATSEAMSKDLHISPDEVSAYDDFIKDMAKVSARNGELQRIVKEVIELAQKRVNEAKIICPACGGRAERWQVTGVYCTKCKRTANAGNTEDSLRMLSVFKGDRP